MNASLSPVSQLVAVIQSQLARPAAPRADRRGATKAGASDTAAGSYAPDRLAGLIALRVGQIERDDPQRGRKALRIFLEAVLLGHFGAQFANDPAFQRMLDDIQLSMEGHPGSRALLDRAIAHLLSE